MSNKHVFSFFTKGVYSFRRFNRNKELIPKFWRSHRESTFANIQLSFRNKKLFDLRTLSGQVTADEHVIVVLHVLTNPYVDCQITASSACWRPGASACPAPECQCTTYPRVPVHPLNRIITTNAVLALATLLLLVGAHGSKFWR